VDKEVDKGSIKLCGRAAEILSHANANPKALWLAVEKKAAAGVDWIQNGSQNKFDKIRQRLAVFDESEVRSISGTITPSRAWSCSIAARAESAAALTRAWSGQKAQAPVLLRSETTQPATTTRQLSRDDEIDNYGIASGGTTCSTSFSKRGSPRNGSSIGSTLM
jgi:hypothetical protein